MKVKLQKKKPSHLSLDQYLMNSVSLSLSLSTQRKQLEQLCSEQKSKIAALEQELSALRAESEVAMQKQMEDLSALQAKCQGLEEDRVRMSQQHEQEVTGSRRASLFSVPFNAFVGGLSDKSHHFHARFGVWH